MASTGTVLTRNLFQMLEECAQGYQRVGRHRNRIVFSFNSHSKTYRLRIDECGAERNARVALAWSMPDRWSMLHLPGLFHPLENEGIPWLLNEWIGIACSTSIGIRARQKAICASTASTFVMPPLGSRIRSN